jgi:hypothetical protein
MEPSLPPSKKRRKGGLLNMAATSSTADAPPVSAINYKWNDKNVFHGIDQDRVPSDKLFDRAHYYAILDKLPVTAGHALLITKHKAATLLDSMRPEAAADTMGDLQVRQNSGAAAVRGSSGCRFGQGAWCDRWGSTCGC